MFLNHVGCSALYIIINTLHRLTCIAKVAVPTQVMNFSRLRTWYLFNFYCSKGYRMNRSAQRKQWDWISRVFLGRQNVSKTHRDMPINFRYFAQISRHNIQTITVWAFQILKKLPRKSHQAQHSAPFTNSLEVCVYEDSIQSIASKIVSFMGKKYYYYHKE